jgi:hypothetical protein
MHEWYFLSSYYIENVCISLELLAINDCSKKHMKENTVPNCSVIFFTGKSHVPPPLQKNSWIPENGIILKCTALAFVEVISFPWCDDLVIQKCTSVPQYGKCVVHVSKILPLLQG